ncbi:MAG: hypothetical protein ACREA7_04900 [Nitrosotalea sp.]
MPGEVTKWLKAHPNFVGCVHTNLQTGVSSQVSCKHPEAQMHERIKGGMKTHPITGDYSYEIKDLDCSTHCWLGGEFNDDGPYNEITAYTDVGSVPLNLPTLFSYWSSLDQCSPTNCPSPQLLVQSGWEYENGGSTPQMFTELVGTFTLPGNSKNCQQMYCGTVDNVAASDQIYTANYYDSGASEWVAYAEDDSASPSFSDFTVASSSVTTVSGSLANAHVSMEAKQMSDPTYWPANSVSLTSVTLYKAGTGQVNANTSNIVEWEKPECGTCTIDETFTATGSTTATITNSW